MNETLKKAWLSRPIESREAIIKELHDMSMSWVDGECEFESKEDSETLAIVVSILKDIEANT